MSSHLEILNSFAKSSGLIEARGVEPGPWMMLCISPKISICGFNLADKLQCDKLPFRKMFAAKDRTAASLRIYSINLYVVLVRALPLTIHEPGVAF